MHLSQYKYHYFILIPLVIAFAVLSLPAYADGVKIIIVGSGFDRHHSSTYYGPSHRSDYGNSYRLRNKHYFDNRYRTSYGNRYYGQRNNQDNAYRNNYRYNNRNYNRNNRSYCPY